MRQLLLRFLLGLALGGLLNLIAYHEAAGGHAVAGGGFVLTVPVVVYMLGGVVPFEVVLWGAPVLWGLYFAVLPVLPREEVRFFALGGILALHLVGAIWLVGAPGFFSGAWPFLLVFAGTVALLYRLTCRRAPDSRGGRTSVSP